MTDHKELRRLAAKTLEGEPMTPAQLMEAYDLSDIAEMLFEVNTLRIKDAQAVTALLDELDKDKQLLKISEESRLFWRAAASFENAAKEKAVAERDQLRVKVAQFEAMGWICDGSQPCEYKDAALTAINNANLREALATPHTAATTEAFLNTTGCTQNTICEGCPPADYPTDETRCLPCPRRKAADSVQVRTPGTVEVCSGCQKGPDFWHADCNGFPEFPCPIRPKQGRDDGR